MPKPRRGKPFSSPLRYLLWIIVFAIAGYIGYSVWYTKQVNPEQGLVVCVPAGQQKTFTYTTESGEKVASTIGGGKDACFWSAHIHATMDLTYCGAHMDMPKDKGILSGPHMHKEPNKMHSPHSPQKVDPATKQFLDPTPLTVKGFLDAMEIDTVKPCPGKQASAARLSASGLQVKEGLNYVWKDGDNISVRYE